MRFSSTSSSPLCHRRSLATASTLILLMTITNIAMLCHASPVPLQQFDMLKSLSAYDKLTTTKNDKVEHSQSQPHPSMLSARAEEVQEAAQLPRQRVEITTTIFKTRGGIVDQDEFEMGRTGLTPVVLDPVMTISQNSPGMRCTYTGDNGGVFVVDHGTTVRVEPAQSFVDVDCEPVEL